MSEAVSSAALDALHKLAALEAALLAPPDSADSLGSQLNALAKSLETLRKAGATCNVALPAEVVSDIDMGRNPAAYTARCAEETTIRNQATSGRIQAFAELQAALLKASKAP